MEPLTIVGLVSAFIGSIAGLTQIKEYFDKRRKKRVDSLNNNSLESIRVEPPSKFEPPQGWHEDVNRGFARAKESLQEQGVLAEKRHQRILLVDDDEHLLGLLEDHLKFTNCYKVIQAKNGEEALRILEQEMPDLIISDVMMPGMNGYDFTKRVRQTPYINWIPIILMSAYKCRAIDRVKGLNAGAIAYINKPFNTDEFLAQIKTSLEQTELLINRSRSNKP
jgi:CheY-like chemotaxis protein